MVALTSRTSPKATSLRPSAKWAGASRCRQKFLRYFPHGFRDADYIDLERDYKWDAHLRWEAELNRSVMRAMLRRGDFSELAMRAVRIESRTNLLFSFEKMAFRDAVKSELGAKRFAIGLYRFLHGKDRLEVRFDRWRDTIGELPKRQTRVLTWPVLTVFGFLAQPNIHVYLKPTVTRLAASRYTFDFQYHSKPTFVTYASLLQFADTIRRDNRDLRPRDMIDLQSFIWVQGSDEY